MRLLWIYMFTFVSCCVLWVDVGFAQEETSDQLSETETTVETTYEYPEKSVAESLTLQQNNQPTNNCSLIGRLSMNPTTEQLRKVRLKIHRPEDVTLMLEENYIGATKIYVEQHDAATYFTIVAENEFFTIGND